MTSSRTNFTIVGVKEVTGEFVSGLPYHSLVFTLEPKGFVVTSTKYEPYVSSDGRITKKRALQILQEAVGLPNTSDFNKLIGKTFSGIGEARGPLVGLKVRAFTIRKAIK